MIESIEHDIKMLEDERVRHEKRIQEINSALSEKYKAWHAERFKARVAQVDSE